MYIYIYIYISLCVCVCNHENTVSSQLSPQLLCGDSCTQAYDARLHIAGTNEPESAQQVVITGRAQSFHDYITCYAHLTCLRFEQYVCHESLK